MRNLAKQEQGRVRLRSKAGAGRYLSAREMALYLIRHGQSTVNAANMEANYSGLVYHEEQYRDAPLNETGVSQAREAAKQFSSSTDGQGCTIIPSKRAYFLVSYACFYLQVCHMMSMCVPFGLVHPKTN